MPITTSRTLEVICKKVLALSHSIAVLVVRDLRGPFSVATFKDGQIRRDHLKDINFSYCFAFRLYLLAILVTLMCCLTGAMALVAILGLSARDTSSVLITLATPTPLFGSRLAVVKSTNGLRPSRPPRPSQTACAITATQRRPIRPKTTTPATQRANIGAAPRPVGIA